MQITYKGKIIKLDIINPQLDKHGRAFLCVGSSIDWNSKPINKSYCVTHTFRYVGTEERFSVYCNQYGEVLKFC